MQERYGMGTEVAQAQLPETQKRRIEGRAARTEYMLNHVETIGFGTDREWILRRMAGMGHPVDTIKKARSSQNTRETADVLGSHTSGGPDKGTIDVYKHRANLEPIVLFGVLAHELQHAVSPLRDENAFLYNSEEKMTEAADFATGIAKQTEATNVFINPYHKYHYNLLQKARLNYALGNKTEADKQLLADHEWLFKEETFAIVGELRFTNPEHLKNIQDQQEKSLDRRKGAGEKMPGFVNLISYEIKGETVVAGIDKIFINLFSEVSDLDSLDMHIAREKAEFTNGKYTFPGTGYIQ